MTRARSLVLFATTIVVAACADRVSAPPKVVPDPSGVATLVVSGSASKPGATVTVSAHLSQAAAAKQTGAYLARIEYDTTVVTYLGQGDGTGGIAAFHAQDGVLRVAGATLDGYLGGVLFNAQFRVVQPSSQAELRLVIDELRDLNLSDRLPVQASARSALVRPWR
jgi:hypothetical protein